MKLPNSDGPVSAPVTVTEEGGFRAQGFGFRVSGVGIRLGIRTLTQQFGIDNASCFRQRGLRGSPQAPEAMETQKHACLDAKFVQAGMVLPNATKSRWERGVLLVFLRTWTCVGSAALLFT